MPFGDMPSARHILEIQLNRRESGPMFTAMIDGRGDMLDELTMHKRMATHSVQRMRKRYNISFLCKLAFINKPP